MRRKLRQVGIAIAGAALILAGLVMAIPFVPGPGTVFIAAGIAVLAAEFHWARRLMIRLKTWGRRILPESLARRIQFSEKEKRAMEGIPK